MTRPRPQGCWSHCGAKCIAEEMNACRRDIPLYEMPPPNEGMQTLATVRFGRREYDDELTADPLNWRSKLSPSDHYALKLICRDPDATNVGGWKWAFQGVLLWEPELLTNCIQSQPPVVDAIWHVARQVSTVNSAFGNNLPDYQLRPLTRELRVLYNGRYKTEATSLYGGFLAPMHARILEDNPTLTPEVHVKKSAKFFELAIDLIAKWCIADYYDQQDVWAVVLAKYANLGEQWNDVIENRRLREASGKKYRLKRKPVEVAYDPASQPAASTRTGIKFKRKAREANREETIPEPPGRED